MQFEVSGRVYEFDAAPERLMGDELLLIDDQLPVGWAQRWASMEFNLRDIVVLTYVAARRGGDERPFDEFVKTIAPATFRLVDDAPPAKPRAKAKAAPLEGPLGPMVRDRKTKAKSAAG